MSTPLTLLPHAAARRSNANLTSPADANEHADADDDGELDMELQTFFPRRTSAITASSDPLPLSAIRQPWKRTLHALLEHPNSSPSAFLIHITTTSLILLSALVTILETIPAFHATSARVWFGIETALVVLFTVEYVARSLAWSVRWDTFLSWFFCEHGLQVEAHSTELYASSLLWYHRPPCHITLLRRAIAWCRYRMSKSSLIPWLQIIEMHLSSLSCSASPFFELSASYVSSVLSGRTTPSCCALLHPISCNIRISNHPHRTIEVMYLSVKRSQHALLALGFFLLMFLVIFSTILYVLSDQSHSRTIFLNLNPRYFAERGTWDPTLETFIDGEGEVSQFSVRRLFPSLNLPSNTSYPDSPSQQQPGSCLSVRTPPITHPLTH